jgi:hypothetical protein
MLGPGCPPRTFEPFRNAGCAGAARFSRSEFRVGDGAWLLADAERARARHQPERGALRHLLARTFAAASRFAGVFL